MPTTLTYEQFRLALVQLGFNAVAAPGYTIYRNDSHDATLVIPDVSPAERVLHVHLVAARETILGNGIPINRELRRLFKLPLAETTVSDNARSAVPVALRPAKVGRSPETAVLGMSDERKMALQAKLRKERGH